ncbi:MAG: ABC transporter permease [Bacilli bacterium]|nr:ABC transporter permease [Bacilli bacterium]MDD4809350.1 ABC transporter permease [Bacilli bacterium]
MRSKLNYLISISLNRKIKTKWFVIANVILCLVIISIANVDSIITVFGGDFDKKQKVYVIDNTEVSYDLFSEQIKITSQTLNKSEESSYELIKYDKTVEDAKKMLAEEEKDLSMLIVFDTSVDNVLDTKIITKEYMDMIDSQIINNAINNTKVALAIMQSNVSIEDINKIYAPVDVERVYLDKDKNSQDENMDIIMTTVFPVIILPFFMLSIFLVQMIGAEVNDEKTTRGMEIIISNVSPKTHFFAKVIAGNLFVLIQGILLVLFGALGLLIRKLIGNNNIVNGITNEVGDIISNLLSSGFGDKLIYIIPLTLLLMILTFVAYSLLAGILASMTTNIEDFQQLQTPIMIISLIGYYLAMMAGVFEGAAFIRVLSYVPFISAILCPSLLVLGQIGIVDVVIAMVLVVITNYLLIKYGLRIYKVGILNYSSSGLWKKMFKALKS